MQVEFTAMPGMHHFAYSFTKNDLLAFFRVWIKTVVVSRELVSTTIINPNWQVAVWNVFLSVEEKSAMCEVLEREMNSGELSCFKKCLKKVTRYDEKRVVLS